jgi:predicted TIM-barrel fold metal-dependent hydrolase
MIVTHAMGHPVDMTLDQMKEAVSLGAFIEFAGGFVLGKASPYTVQQNIDAIRALGPDHVILSSDSGQVGQPYPDDMMGLMAGRFRELGVTTAELRKMMVTNPATLLGVPQR